MSERVVIVGGGAIGLSCAWRAAAAGFAVRLIDEPSPRSGSWVAGGMLAPITEAWPGEESLLELGSQSLARWPAFAERLSAEGGDVGLTAHGTVVAGTDSADAEVLDMLAGHLAGVGRQVHEVDAAALRELIPGLGPSVRSGLFVPEDLAVDNRRLLTALQEACRVHNVLSHGGHVERVEPGAVTFADGSTVDGDVVIVAAGAWSALLHPALATAVRPVKGEILRLAHRPGALPPPVHTVRARVEGRAVYLVPRDDGLVLGATQYEAGFDEGVKVSGVRDLLRDAEVVLPGLAEYSLAEAGVGFRATSADNLPLIGWVEPGVMVASGHHRNGLLLAPLTADAVLDLLQGNELPDVARPTDAARLNKERTA
ncbi:glycine oxidase [Herbihabitans rhizosphaerae]|uniref:glycine oxidase n=1 Tax=Herbihabitans rhizosphaerae TaxID=1872711 RepID=A0A4Q7KWJ0_9PSEU|nr:glycine oxidase ThiO [Herbihabitans rhizosphaerae]RZS41134.1 glycine oxidase [Herbihabitans rhizosphaerae]